MLTRRSLAPSSDQTLCPHGATINAQDDLAFEQHMLHCPRCMGVITAESEAFMKELDALRPRYRVAVALRTALEAQRPRHPPAD